MSKNIIPLTADRLRELLHYDPETGVFVWRVRCGRLLPGVVAGCNNAGYRIIRIDNVAYRAHRLAWLYMYNYWPRTLVDHADGNKGNNRILNLREVTHSVNAQNQRRARVDNTTGLLGVAYYRANKTYTAQIRVLGVKKHLGYFRTAELAHAAYLDAKRRLHVGCKI